MQVADDHRHLRRAIALAHEAAARGDRPFGAVLLGGDGATMEASNTQRTESDQTAHAEMNLVRRAMGEPGAAALAGSTVYASGEPCPMCATALYWCGVARIVFAVGAPRLYELLGDPPDALRLGCAELLGRAGRPVEVIGPLLEEEGASAFA